MLRINLVLVCLVILLTGCVSSRAPYGRLPEVEDLARDPFGAWVRIEYAVFPRDTVTLDPSTGLAADRKVQSSGRNVARFVEGEFIAFKSESINRESVIVLSDGGQIVEIPQNRIQRVILELYRKSTTGYGIWTALGLLSTVTHGWYAMFSIPMWLISGIITTSGESRRDRWNEVQPSSEWWISMEDFARFPQGLPVNLDVKTLKPATKLGMRN